MPEQVHIASTFFSCCRHVVAEHRKNLRLAVADFLAKAGSSLAAHRATRRELERVEASDFTVFSWMDPDENRLSDIFADLLRPQGSHGQGTLFLAELLQMSGISPNFWMDGLDQAKVWREDATWSIDNRLRRIDITVDLPQFGIGIENKPSASDQPDQVADYAKHLNRRYGKRFVLFYWSGHGGMPSSIKEEVRKTLERDKQLCIWSYQRELRRWLQSSRRECKANKVCFFIDDFLAYLARTYLDKPVRWKERV